MKISVVIPTLNEAGNILASIHSVRMQPGEHQIIVVDAGSTDGTAAIARPHAEVLLGERGRGAQMNLGARQAMGDVLLFLHGDSVLHPQAFAGLRAALSTPATAGGTFTLAFEGEELPLRLYAFLTRFRFRHFHFGDQGIFVRREVFERLGGFREAPLMEDVDFLQRLSRVGGRALVPQPVTTSARRFRTHGLLRQQLLNTALVTAYLLGVEPERLARWYRNGRS